MRRVLIVTGAVVVLLILVAAVVLANWTATPHGRLDVEVAVLLKLVGDRPTPGSVSVEQERAEFRDAMRRLSGREVPLASVEDRSCTGPRGEIPLRVYRPGGEPLLPVLVFYHGGAFRIGDLDTHDALCRKLARRSGAVVVAVDYRLVPEHRFPAAVDDAYAALQCVHDRSAELGVDAERVAVGGDSAGGNLAAVVSLMSRDHGGPPLRFQLLIYPVLDLSAFDTDSHELFRSGYFLARETMEHSRAEYIPEPRERTAAYASPLLAPDHAGLPAALVITAGFDPLRDEGEAYARALREAGVDARASRYEGVIHGFVLIPWIRKSERAIDEAAAALRQAFAR